ncbi:hypothetical protein TRIUR3_23394 [Triticum urartu]|uniref:Uncharacterized protein n=2 Tax=Triticum urartu TaxID=4572 RepID=M7YVA0_TRIUA|nr:hypothetical protein TRIUR3_23394 [Triticum urartu]
MAAGARSLERVSDALRSEALAMLYAINTTIQMGCNRVIMETDSIQNHPEKEIREESNQFPSPVRLIPSPKGLSGIEEFSARIANEKCFPILAVTFYCVSMFFFVLIRLSIHAYAQNVRVIIFDVRGGGQELRSMVNRRMTRHRAMALLVYMGVPVTPAPNPFNRPSPGHSYHIIRLIDPYQPRLQVDLLIRDTDLYLVAFRRSLDDNWGNWYRFSDQQVPSFIVALDLGFTSNYSRVPGSIPTVGGPEDMVFIFNTLARHEDRLRLVIPAVQRTLHIATVQRAVQNAAVVFCEVMRFIAVLLEMVRRLEAGEAASVLPGEMWDMITSWHVDCWFILDVRRRLALPAHHWESHVNEVDRQRFDQLINRVSVIIYIPELFTSDTRRMTRWQENEVRNIQDPGFPAADA